MRRLLPLLLSCIAACGGSTAPPGPALLRPVVQPAPGALAHPTPRLLEAIEAPEDPGAWAAESLEDAPAPRPSEYGILFPGGTGGRLRIEGPLPEGFNAAALRMRLRASRARVTVSLTDRRGTRLSMPATTVLDPEEGVMPVLVEAPLLIHQRGLRDLEVLVEGGPCAVEGIDLWTRPPGSDLPAPGGAATPITAVNVTRPGWGLVRHRPVTASLGTPGPGGVLHFATATTRSTRMGNNGARVVVTLSSESGRKEEHEVPLRTSLQELRDWDDHSLSLEAFAGSPCTAEFRLELDTPEEAACALGGIAVRHPGADSRVTLLITSDTHRADHLGIADGSHGIRTPHLDRLAERGTLFESAWSSTNVTSPSHTSLFTGLLPRDTRVTSNTARLAPEAETLGEAFRDAGWWTVAAVSVRHLGPTGTDVCQGFDRVWSPTGPPPTAELPAKVLQEWIQEAEGRPVFAWLHVFDAHDPYEPPQPFRDAVWDPEDDPFDESLPALDWAPGTYAPRLKGLRDVRWPSALYRGEVEWLDHALGPLLQFAEARDALIGFTADHGEELDGGLSRFDHRTLTPGVLHVPLLLAGPEVPEGQRVRGLRTHLDLGRTLLDLSGLGAANLPGRNLLLPPVEEDPTVFALAAHGFTASATRGRWHLMLQLRLQRSAPLIRQFEVGELALFDMEADPDCHEDVHAMNEDTTRALLTDLLEWLQRREGPSLVRTRTTSGAERQELAALGYATGSAIEGDESPWFDPSLTAQDVLDAQTP